MQNSGAGTIMDGATAVAWSPGVADPQVLSASCRTHEPA